MKNFTFPKGIIPLFLLIFSFSAISFDLSAQTGCTDDLACNYDSGAVTDDGSCFYNGWYIPVTPGAGPAVQACEAPDGYIIPDQTCVESVIALDDYCIDVEWDSVCQDEYESCLGCTPQLYIPVGTNIGPVLYACETPDGYVLADPCIVNVINTDSYCVNVEWDDICLDEYALCLGCTPQIYLPGDIAGPAYFGCTPPKSYELAESQDCAATVIESDPWCIETAWDNACVEAYNLCLYGCIDPGCTDPSACNYDALAGCDDGSCILPDGCTNPVACNYDPAATCDDGSCILPDGCTDPTACNFDPAALCEDGSCIFNGPFYWIPSTVSGPVLLSCEQPAGYIIANQPCIEWLISVDDYCIDVEWDFVCQDAYFGCMTGLNSGCSYPDADNYNPTAVIDDGTCIFSGSNPCPADINGDGIINTGDLTTLLSQFGNTCIVVLNGGSNQ